MDNEGDDDDDGDVDERTSAVAGGVVFRFKMGSVGPNYKHPHCDVIGKRGYAWDPIGYPICTFGAANCFTKAMRRGLVTRKLVQQAKYKPIFQKGTFEDERRIGFRLRKQDRQIIQCILIASDGKMKYISGLTR